MFTDDYRQRAAQRPGSSLRTGSPLFARYSGLAAIAQTRLRRKHVCPVQPGISGYCRDGKRNDSVNRAQDLTRKLEQFYTDYFANDFSKYTLSPEYAAGFQAFPDALRKLTPRAVKGHVTGPISWGLTVTDETGKGIIYDETFGDVVPKFLRMKASRQEQILSKINRNTIMFVDEPYMTAFGSIAMQVSREQVITVLEETFAGIRGIKGVHCCGNTDWSILLQTSTNVVHFDTYTYPDSLAIYTKEVKKFLASGNCIGWGIIPTDAEAVNKESVASLKDRLEAAIVPFTGKAFRLKHWSSRDCYCLPAD